MACSRILLGCVLLTIAATEVQGQDGVLLRLRPRLGDTLYMRIEQQMEMRGRPHDADSERSMTTTLRVRARAIPTRMAGGATILTTITDSLIIGSPVSPPQQLDQVRRSLVGRAVEVRVLPDGAMEVLNRDDHEDDVSPLFGQMPAVLPAVAVRPGEQWVREMRLPLRGSLGSPGTVRATFRLDSLGRGVRVAYISVRGTFQERPSAAAVDRVTEGSLTGAIEFDRDLGWISDMRTTVVTRSDVRLPDSRTPPLAVWMRITQTLQARTIP